MASSSEHRAEGILASECAVHRLKPRGSFCRLVLRMPADFPDPRPGQFVLISCSASSEDLIPPPERGLGGHLARFTMGPVDDRTTLPRPMSVFDYEKPSKKGPGLLTLVFKAVGRGTLLLSQVRPGDQLRFLGPLGNGFDAKDWKRTLLVAGGVGFSGVNFLAKALAADKRPPLIVLGINSRGQSPVRLSLTEVPPVYRWALPETTEPLRLVVSRLFDDFIPSVVTSMYPGDEGAFCGTACELVERLLDANPSYAADTTLVGCGPRPMLQVLADIARHRHVKRFLVVVEERMACGVGTCLGCVVQTRETALPSEGSEGEGTLAYKRICTDGPVFNGYSILWDRPREH
ncbi:MAG: hypothetical protein JW759_02430 [Candidatus Coatesbacteria bacterium]|nr:hypothetical protein [Candidatus Coatesbacteria bacterium]